MKLLALTTLALFAAPSFGTTPIDNFREVSPVLYRGAKPTNAAAIGFLHRLGVRTIFDLQGGDAILEINPSERQDSILQEGEWARQLGLTFENIPVPATHDPSPEEESWIHELISKMRDPRLQPVFVHCGMGEDRTGLVVALYKYCTSDVDPRQIYAEMIANGHTGLHAFFTSNVDEYFWKAVKTPHWCQSRARGRGPASASTAPSIADNEALVSDGRFQAQASVIINAPESAVWDYNANNDNAKDWSVYFRQIGECPVEKCPNNANLSPSAIGYVRRCYRDGLDSKTYWDEETLAVTDAPNGRIKQIRMFNLHGFSAAHAAEFLVEQIYEPLDARTTKLTFKSTLFNMDKLTSAVSLPRYYAWLWSGYAYGEARTTAIYQENLTNIKAAIEDGANYVRVYPWESASSWMF